MRAATGTDVSPLKTFRTELTILRARQHNVLLEGPRALTDAVLCQLCQHIPKPVVWHQGAERLHLPRGEAGALILTDVGALTADDQTRLLAWIGETRSSTQIVSTTECQL
jgi:hypothetical protein